MSNFFYDGSYLMANQTKATVLFRKKYFDALEAFANVLPIFGRMDLNRSGKYTILDVQASGFMWEKYKPCASGDGGHIVVGQREVQPCKLQSTIKYCSDLVNTCFENLAVWGRNGQDLNTPEIQALMDEVFSQAIGESTRSLRSTMMLSGFHEVLGLEPVYDGLTEDEINAFEEVRNACSGLLSLIFSEGIECEDLFNGSFENCKYTGNIADVFEKLRCCAEQGGSDNMISLVNQGFNGLANSQSPVHPISLNLMSAVRQAFANQTANASTAPQVFTRERITAADGASAWVYAYEGIPIIPIPVNDWDKIYGKELLFAALTTTGTLQMGTSFGEATTVNQTPVGYQIYNDPRPSMRNMYEMYSEVLIATSIRNSKDITFGYAFAE